MSLRKNRKNLFLILASLMLIAALTLFGCGTSDDSGTDTTNTTPTDTTPTDTTPTDTTPTDTTPTDTTPTDTTPTDTTPPGEDYQGVDVLTNVFIDSILPDANYKFFHGSSSNDGTKTLITVNKADAPQGTTTGVSDLYVLDNEDLVNATVTELASGQATGSTGTITFRSDWSDDDTMIAVAGADRLFILDAETLAATNGANGYTGIGGENHDAMFTSDGKYVIMTLRTSPYSGDDAAKKDGEIQLYDVAAGAVVGGTVSVCNECHGQTTPKNSILCGVDGVVDPQTDGTYTGTIYVAGHGGHIAKIAVTIDPANTTDPISVDLTKLTVSSVKFSTGDSQYKLHDVRLDGDTLYWSTYNTDANGMLHYGSIDTTKTSSYVTADVEVAVDARATKPGPGVDKMPNYCASGQTKNYYMPITMTHEAYISVIPKSTVTGTATPPPSIVKAATNVFLDSILPDANYKFFHGSTSPDGSKMMMAVNKAGTPFGATTGEADIYILDAAELAKGNVSQIGSTATITGDNTGPMGASITFRSDWSADGTMIGLAGADRVWILDSTTLAPLNGANGDIAIGGQSHDVLFTEDGKYAIMTLRVKPYTDANAAKFDGVVQLYDVVTNTALGTATSVCNDCHGQTEPKNSTLCGLDGEVTVNPASGGYPESGAGTIYVAGHGGHFAKCDLTIDPAATKPITANCEKLTVSTSKFLTAPATFDEGQAAYETTSAYGTSQYKLHDPRLDGDTLYWSTYNTDENGLIHFGKIDLATDDVTDKTIEVDVRATLPADDTTLGNINKSPMYCASGQTDATFMPITMTHEAYLTVIPKANIN